MEMAVRQSPRCQRLRGKKTQNTCLPGGLAGCKREALAPRLVPGRLLRLCLPFTSRELKSHHCAGSLRDVRTYLLPLRLKVFIISSPDGSFDQI